MAPSGRALFAASLDGNGARHTRTAEPGRALTHDIRSVLQLYEAMKGEATGRSDREKGRARVHPYTESFFGFHS